MWVKSLILFLFFTIAHTSQGGDQSFVTLSCANAIVWASPTTANAIPKYNFISPRSADGKPNVESFQGNKNVLLAGTADKFAVYDSQKKEIQIWTETGELIEALGQELLGKLDPASFKLTMYSDNDFVLLNVVQTDGFFKTIVKKSSRDKFRVQSIEEICGSLASCVLSKDGRLSFLAVNDGNWLLMENKVVSDLGFYKGDVTIPTKGSLLQVSLDTEINSRKFYSHVAQIGETKSLGAAFSKQSHFLLSRGLEQLEVYELDQRYFETLNKKDLYYRLKHVMKMDSDLLGSISKISISEKGKYFAFSTEDGLVYVATVGSYPNSKFSSVPLDVINLGNKKITALDISDGSGLTTIVTEDGFLLQYLFEINNLKSILERSLNPKRITTIHVQTPTLSAPILGQKPGLL